MGKILISVVIPAYNEEKLIGTCLSSLKNQDFSKENYEVIVVDNGSTDNTVKIVKHFGNHSGNIRLVSQPRKGLSRAINRGFNESKGKIVAVTNADTVVLPSWVSNIYKAFTKNHDVVAVSGRVVMFPRNLIPGLAEVFMNYIGGIILKDIMGPNFAIRKDIYYKIGGLNENIDFNCETELFLRLKREGRILFLWDNPVITSSRHFAGIEGTKYCVRGAISSMSLLFFKKPVFVNMVDVR
ncbi:MAG: glycosyltransferase [Actinobacteria bacterium]|nr:glycosyltransferase [Actinomycetota bacterium]